MKINIKKDESDKDFYKELLYVSNKYNDVIKKPNLKTHSVFLQYGLYFVSSIIMILILTNLYLQDHRLLLLVTLIFVVLLTLLTVFYCLFSIRFVHSELKSTDKRTLTISKELVELTKGKNYDYKIEWNDIKFILINEHSIAFIPNKRSFLIIGINSIYKDDVINAVKEVKKTDLIIDNTK